MFVITNGKVWVKETSGEFIEVKKCREASQYEKEKSAQDVLGRLNKYQKWVDLQLRVAEYSETVADEDLQNWSSEAIQKELLNIAAFIKCMNKLKESIPDEISRVDLEISDIEHAMEIKNYSVVDGYKVYKMLQDARQRRRELKDRNTLIAALARVGALDVDFDGAIMNAEGRLTNRSYKTKVLTDVFGYEMCKEIKMTDEVVNN